MKKTKTKTKTNKNNNLSTQKPNLFLPTSRLNKSQRKYCKCLMSVRRTAKNPYPICVYSLRQTGRVDFTKTPSSKKTKKSKKQFNPARTNCILNYNYDNFDLKDIQLLAKERKIPISYLNKKRKRVQYKKDTLIHKLTENYLKNKKGKSNKSKKSLKTKSKKQSD